MDKTVEELITELANNHGSDGCIEAIHAIRSVAYQETAIKHTTTREDRDWELITDALDAAEHELEYKLPRSCRNKNKRGNE